VAAEITGASERSVARGKVVLDKGRIGAPCSAMSAGRTANRPTATRPPGARRTHPRVVPNCRGGTTSRQARCLA